MLRNLDTIYDIARSSKNFSTGIYFSENIFWVYRGGGGASDGDGDEEGDGDGDGDKVGRGWRATKWALATAARAIATTTRLEGKKQHPGRC